MRWQMDSGRPLRLCQRQKRLLSGISLYRISFLQLPGISLGHVGSWANQVRILKLQIDSLKATIGQGLINLFTPIIKVVNTVIGKLATLANAFKAFTELITGKKSQGSSAGRQIAEMGSAAVSAGSGMEGAARSC